MKLINNIYSGLEKDAPKTLFGGGLYLSSDTGKVFSYDSGTGKAATYIDKNSATFGKLSLSKAPLTIYHEFEIGQLTGTVSATTQQIIGVGTKFKTELAFNDYIVVEGTAYQVLSIPMDTMLFVASGQETGFSGVTFGKLLNPLENGSLLELKYGSNEAEPLFRISPRGDVVLTGNVSSDRVSAGRVNANYLAGEHVGSLSPGISATTQTAGDNSTKVATTEYVTNEIVANKEGATRAQGLNSNDSIVADVDYIIYQGASDAVLTIETTTNVSEIKVINRSETGDVTFEAGDGVTIKYGGSGKLPKKGTADKELWSCTLIKDPTTFQAWWITDLYTGV